MLTAPDFIPGQRWVSDTEPELGLGSILQVQHRRVTVEFPASSELRTYAIGNTPLTRVEFSSGEKIRDASGDALLVISVQEQGGLITYHGRRDDGSLSALPEHSLDSFLQFSRPQERLFAGQLDATHWFDLRQQTLAHRQRLQQLPFRGLSGARAALLKHQLYIAHQVSSRAVPRVLLADEVGLGKTIEAGLILHRLLLTARVSRVLVMVPPALLNQWLVELLRRFNLHFSLLDEQRCQAIEDSGQADNPFLAEQLVLCSLELFAGNPKRHPQAEQAGWDMLVVDEVHHLQWREGKASQEYLWVERLASSIKGVLLLTATPEQLGREGHFARLRLLDPDRFVSRAALRREQEMFEPVADLVDRLQQRRPLSVVSAGQLLDRLGETGSRPLLQQLAAPDTEGDARNRLIARLMDRHGTGRVLFRNTRSRIKGFPQRRLHHYPLPLPEAYRASQQNTQAGPGGRLSPESIYRLQPGRPWWQFDPRVDWLIARLQQHPGDKLLVICALQKTALELAQALRTREGVTAAVFHESMSIVERDRAAAWFADREQGCRLMICSEIGSEGRNFQFTQQLVLFDLPLDPDQLEQRIGRLDRIGQKADVEIHVPHFAEGAQAVLLRWYRQGLGIFSRTSPAAHAVFRQLEPALLSLLDELPPDPRLLAQLIETASRLRQETERRLSRGRDRLLEFNSCREPEASILLRALQQEDERPGLDSYLEHLATAYGVETEQQAGGGLILRPGPHMSCDSFPGLPAEGISCIFDRATALIYEDRQFLTWEHPLLLDSMQMLLDSGRGNAAARAIRHPAVDAGNLLLELLFVLECPAPAHLQAGRFLPPTMLRMLLDQQHHDRSMQLPPSLIEASSIPLNRAAAVRMIHALRPQIQAMVTRGEKLAQTRKQALIDHGMALLSAEYDSELERITALQRVNPCVRDEEITLLEAEAVELRQHLERAAPRLDALQLIVSL